MRSTLDTNQSYHVSKLSYNMLWKDELSVCKRRTSLCYCKVFFKGDERSYQLIIGAWEINKGSCGKCKWLGRLT
jgi:hypothetical protein